MDARNGKVRVLERFEYFGWMEVRNESINDGRHAQGVVWWIWCFSQF